MKNSNRYKDIFSSKEKLSAKDIEQYNSFSQKEKNAVEQKEMSNSFDEEAMEGWESVEYDTTILSKKKNPFHTRRMFSGLTIILSVLIGVVSTYFIFSIYNKGKNTSQVTQKTIIVNLEPTEIVIESNDVILPKEIEALNEKPIEDQVSIAEIKDDFHRIEEINANLPIAVPHQVSNNIEPALIFQKQKGKEIYLYDLKLVDYNTYRNESVIETKQFILTGTPAELESQNNEDYQTEWKTIQQAYTLYLENTMYYFNNGEYKKALTRFDIILKKYENDVNANFYSGVCLYNFGEYLQAIERFSKCTLGDFNNFDEEAQWMIANSYKNIGESIKAKELFHEIVKTNGFYAKQAMEEL